MRLPWISRSAHDEIKSLLSRQVDELISERRLLLDRLAALGLGGPLFCAPSTDSISESEEPSDPDAEELERLRTSRRRPSKLADALTRKAYRDYNRIQSGANVHWVSQAEAVSAALNQAEALGKQTASPHNQKQK
ncbi:MAG: hypothetical protein WA510_06820 [Acidobacteriaceae bacterium]